MNDSSVAAYPLISVVLATYNGETFLREQIESILHQTYPRIELIIVDDASTDQTVAILNEYESHPTVHIHLSDQNLGHIKNFERGFRLCTGEYIAPCDQDDIWLPTKLEVLQNQIGNHPMIYCDSELIESDGRRMGMNLSDIKRLVTFDSPLNYAIGGSIPGHAMVMRKDVLDDCFPFPESIPHDYWLGFVATFSGPIKFHKEALVQYRQHAHNTVGVNAGKAKARKNQQRSAASRHELIRNRMKILAGKCPENLEEAKLAFRTLDKSYSDFSLPNNFRRLVTFLKHWEEITAYKKKSRFRRLLFCLKSFRKIY